MTDDMATLTRRSLLPNSVGFAATGALTRLHIANAAVTTATVWWVQGFAEQEDVGSSPLRRRELRTVLPQPRRSQRRDRQPNRRPEPQRHKQGYDQPCPCGQFCGRIRCRGFGSRSPGIDALGTGNMVEFRRWIAGHGRLLSALVCVGARARAIVNQFPSNARPKKRDVCETGGAKLG
jgi:molybdopterin/thiamine biosynthesis adenylyltransferase